MDLAHQYQLATKPGEQWAHLLALDQIPVQILDMWVSFIDSQTALLSCCQHC